ncbi:MAG: serine hydrolase [Ignavibacteria bacterium]|nr:serine hydrolase [Ignavibacteria bacterium]
MMPSRSVRAYLLLFFLLAASAAASTGCAAINRFFAPKPKPAPVKVVAPVPVAAAQPALPRVEDLPPDSLLRDDDVAMHPSTASVWVDSLLHALTMREKVAQMIVPFAFSNIEGKKLRDLKSAIVEKKVGGVIISTGSVDEAKRLVDSMQGWARTPLLISADFENGLTMRLAGATEFPSLMALGATRDPALAYEAGRATAREARAVGVLQNYSPVVDVNSNPLNPIINIRSFGEDPAQVASMAEAFMRGLQDGRVIATVKHFPGHGDTETDTHIDMPVLRHSLARLDSVELLPFRRLVDAGVLSVMSGHLAVPAIDSDSARPSTLSPVMLDSLLRGSMGFRGLIVTDALNMKGVTKKYRNGGAAKHAVLAGVDVLLMPPDIDEAIDAVAGAVGSGEISEAVIDHSVRKILLYKEWLGLSARRAPDRTLADTVTNGSEHRALAERIARRAITLVKNEDALLPLAPAPARKVVLLSLLHGRDGEDAGRFTPIMDASFGGLRSFDVEAKLTARQRVALLDSLRGADLVIIASFINGRNGAGGVVLSEDQQALLDRAGALGKAAVLCSFGSPYVVTSMPWVRAYVCAYGSDTPSMHAARDVLLGAVHPVGTLPVSIPGIAARGEGLRFATPLSAASAMPERIAPAFAEVDALIREQIAAHAFPGAQLAVVKDGEVVHLRCYGALKYDSSAAVSPSTMYDIASMTKVVATTTAAMKLVEEGKLDLDRTVASYIPAFGANGKQNVTVRNLLVHNSGLPAFRLYYTFCRSGKEVLDSIYASRLDYATGTRMVYSDLGIITLGKIVEAVAGISLDVYAQAMLFGPLGMAHTMFTPPESLRALCAPTEMDTVWRKRLVQGAVHDETAALLGGVAGHAGLFSTAADLARFARMLLAGGELDGARIVQASTIAQFTKRQGASSRALGWDTRSTAGSSAGRYFSSRSFGHTGFTGTSIWIDPDARVAVVFLTNRVHPTRENRRLIGFRAVLHDAVRQALSSMGG